MPVVLHEACVVLAVDELSRVDLGGLGLVGLAKQEAGSSVARGGGEKPRQAVSAERKAKWPLKYVG